MRFEGASAGELARVTHDARRIYPYLLPYQARNDAPLQRRLGLLLQRSVLVAHPDLGAELPLPSRDERLPVGFVSHQFHNHTVWHVITRGWLAGLRRRGFDCFGYQVGKREDECSEVSRRDCVRFRSGTWSLREWADVVRGDRLHALIYPALGYSKTANRLALARPAPVQCVTLGHCETSGYPAMDYFLSGALMEPDDGDAHYTE